MGYAQPLAGNFIHRGRRQRLTRPTPKQFLGSTVTSAQPWQSKDWVTVLTNGCSYTVIVSVGLLKGAQGVAVKVHCSIGPPWASAALCLQCRCQRIEECCLKVQWDVYTVAAQAMMLAAIERYFMLSLR